MKISLKEWNDICQYHPAEKSFRQFCVHTITKTPEGFRRTCYIGLQFYIIIHILNIFCYQNSKLKKFRVLPRQFPSDYFYKDTPAYKKAQEIFDKRIDKFFFV